MNETLVWLEEKVEKQKTVALDEDPAFKVSEIDFRFKRVETLWTRLNNTPKPKEAKKKKMPKNIKIDNMTFDGSSDFNMDDFIQYGNSADDEEDSGSYQS